MDNDTLVEKLQKETIKITLDNELDRELLLNDQVTCNNLLVGVILNKIVDKDTFEVYIYIKTTNKILVLLSIW